MIMGHVKQFLHSGIFIFCVEEICFIWKYIPSWESLNLQSEVVQDDTSSPFVYIRLVAEGDTSAIDLFRNSLDKP